MRQSPARCSGTSEGRRSAWLQKDGSIDLGMREANYGKIPLLLARVLPIYVLNKHMPYFNSGGVGLIQCEECPKHVRTPVIEWILLFSLD